MITNPKQIAKKLDRVEINEETSEVGCGRGNMERKTAKVYVVTPVWKGVARPVTSSYSCSTNKKLAQRLKAAMEDGVAFEGINVIEDAHSESYVQARMKVMMRYANADLKKLGY